MSALAGSDVASEAEVSADDAGARVRARYAAFDAEMAGRSFDAQVVLRLLRWLRPHAHVAIASGVLVLVASCLAIAMPVIVTRVVIDDVLGAGQPIVAPDFGMNAYVNWIGSLTDLPLLLAAVLGYMLVTTGWVLAGHFHRVLLARAVLGALRDLRHDLFTHLEHRSSAFYDHVAVGRVMTRVTNDVEVLFQLLSGFGVLIGEFVPFFVAVSMMLVINAELTVLLMASLPLVALSTWLFRRATRGVYRAIRESISALNQNLQENLSGIQVVQLNRREARNLARYTQLNQDNRAHERQAVRLEVYYGAFMDSMANAALAVIVWFGGGEIVQQTISLGSIVLFSQCVDMLFRPIVALGEQYNVLFRAMASAERIFQALDWGESVHEPEHPQRIDGRLRGELDIRNLTFGYYPGSPVLKDVTLHVAPGERLAIVGPTGSGKSTIIRLLARFYDVEDGHILVDGVDINRLASRDLRRRIGVVLQDFHIFSGTVADNISLGHPDITRADVEQAARLVNAHEFISRLPDGYDTRLTERGQNLSQGQRQLLAFARVLASDPEILVLDEATASIDTETEALIEAALAQVTHGRTSILIAHRLKTIRDADRIVVLHHGVVREVGSHDELLAAGGLYAELYHMQFESRET